MQTHTSHRRRPRLVVRVSASLSVLALAGVAHAQSSATLSLIRKTQVDPSGTGGAVDGCEFSKDGTLIPPYSPPDEGRS